MSAAVVDENVPIVANDIIRAGSKLVPIAPQADDACRLAVVQRLRQLTTTGIIVIDDAGEVIQRYRGYLSGKGQPGLGDAFLKYLADNEFNSTKVSRIPLLKTCDGSYDAFPRDPDLKTFDLDDRIYVALVLASQRSAILLNAVDSDYSHHQAALTRHGVRVEELCPGLLKPGMERKAP